MSRLMAGAVVHGCPMKVMAAFTVVAPYLRPEMSSLYLSRRRLSLFTLSSASSHDSSMPWQKNSIHPSQSPRVDTSRSLSW